LTREYARKGKYVDVQLIVDEVIIDVFGSLLTSHRLALLDFIHLLLEAQTKGDFSTFISLYRSDQISINDDNRYLCGSLIEELKNADLSAIIFDGPQEEMSFEIEIGRFRRSLRLNNNSPRTIEFIASHCDDESVRKLGEVKELRK
jgi:hypothetical protein